MSEWTPGPWTAETVPTAVGICHKIGPHSVCLYEDYPTNPEGDLQADARLIALAPEMADLLEHIDKHGRPPSDPLHWPGPCSMDLPEQARALLARARGDL